jgi:hypothetical protein
MIRCRMSAILWLALPAFGAALAVDAEAPRESAAAERTSAVPPVLRAPERADNRVIMLPGRAPDPKPEPAAVTPAPVPPPTPQNPPAKPAASAAVKRPPVPAVEDRSKSRREKPAYPADFQKDSANYLRQRLGRWKSADARTILGGHLRERPAAENGRILAYADPTGRYQSLELDFDSRTGKLRTVFAYPKELSWEACRKLWGESVLPAPARNGRMFYSYSNQRLDVLVSASGKVVSLGMY